MNLNNVVLIGRLTRDPELKYIGSGTAVATFSIAIDRDYKNRDGSTTTDFIPIEIMGKAAEFCANYITKGRLVAIQGSIRVDRYETSSGEKRSFTKVFGRSVTPLEGKNSQSNFTSPDANSNSGEPEFEPSGVINPSEFSAVEDDDVPF